MAATKSNNSTILYIIIGLLVAVVAYFLYKMYQDDKAANKVTAPVTPVETAPPAPPEVMPTAPAESDAGSGIADWKLKMWGLK